MAPSRRVSNRQVVSTPHLRGGIRRSQRTRRAPARQTEPSPERDTITLAVPESPASGSELSTSETPSSTTLVDHPCNTPAQQPVISLQMMNNILAQREDQLVDRILSQLAGTRENPFEINHSASNTLSSHQRFHTPAEDTFPQGTGVPDVLRDHDSTYIPQPALVESAFATLDSVKLLFPGVDRSTLTQIIENRFKPTNIYRLLASEKDRAESQRVISIGGVSFEQGEREGKESEYQVGPFFKAWVAYCGILTKLAPGSLQADLACSLFIYTMNLHDLLEKYTWQGVKSYHFQFHRKRIASGKEIYYPDDWRKLDLELIASKCFIFPPPAASTSRNWPYHSRSTGTGNTLGHSDTTTSTPSTVPPLGYMALAHSRTPHTGGVNSACRNWNYRECQVQHCRYTHVCISCGSSHRASQCPKGASMGEGAVSRQ